MIASPSRAKTVIVRKKPFSYSESKPKNTLKKLVFKSSNKSVTLFMDFILKINKFFYCISIKLIIIQ